MAEIASDSGGGGGKHHKKGRKKGGNPRVDMTPMVDLAFLLLTFFVLTSNLNKAKTMELTLPAEKKKDDTAGPKIIDRLANTILLDGNKDGKIYYYQGMIKPDKQPTIQETTLDAKNGLRSYATDRNSHIVADSKQLRDKYKKNQIPEDEFKKQYALIQKNDSLDAPYFIVKWGSDAKYGDVVNVLDELKIADVTRVAITKISGPEYLLLSKKTGRHYPEADTMPTDIQPPH